MGEPSACIYNLYNFFTISPHLRRGPSSFPTKTQYADPNSSIGHIIPSSSFHRQFTMEANKSHQMASICNTLV